MKAIHLKTQLEFNLLMDYFESINRLWCSGEQPKALTYYFDYFGSQLCIIDENFFSAISLTYCKNIGIEIVEFEDYNFLTSSLKKYLKFKNRKTKISGNTGVICGYRDDGKDLLIMAVTKGKSGLDKTLFSSLDHIITHKDNPMGYCYVSERNIIEVTMEQFVKDIETYGDYVNRMTHKLTDTHTQSWAYSIKSFKEMFGYSFVSKDDLGIEFIY
jgi:hypothetical protein